MSLNVSNIYIKARPDLSSCQLPLSKWRMGGNWMWKELDQGRSCITEEVIQLPLSSNFLPEPNFLPDPTSSQPPF